MFHCDAFGIGPIHFSPEPVAPSSFALVLGLFVDAGHTVVFDSNWMKTMRAAVRSHVPEFLKWAPLAAFTCSAVGVDILAIRVRVRFAIELVGHAGDGGGELLNLPLSECWLLCRWHYWPHLRWRVVGCTRGSRRHGLPFDWPIRTDCVLLSPHLHSVCRCQWR